VTQRLTAPDGHPSPGHRALAPFRGPISRWRRSGYSHAPRDAHRVVRLRSADGTSRTARIVCRPASFGHPLGRPGGVRFVGSRQPAANARTRSLIPSGRAHRRHWSPPRRRRSSESRGAARPGDAGSVRVQPPDVPMPTTHRALTKALRSCGWPAASPMDGIPRLRQSASGTIAVARPTRRGSGRPPAVWLSLPGAQGAWMSPMTLPSASVTDATSLPPPTSWIAWCSTAPTARRPLMLW